MATNIKMAVFWGFEPCSLVYIDRRFRGAYCLVALMMEAVNTSETSVSIYQTTRRNIPEDSHLHRLRMFDNSVMREYSNLRRSK
jgi:hypothetical protein